MQNNKPFGVLAGSLLCGLTLTACTGYSFHFNQTEVYTPPALFSDYSIADSALHTCVEQTIKDARVSRVEQLTRLNCSSAGIESLEGLERFRHLAQLNLAGNRLTRVETLEQLSRLEVLVLRDNRLQSPEPLLGLLRLTEADLSGNPDLECSDARQLADNMAGTAILPAHCQQ